MIMMKTLNKWTSSTMTYISPFFELQSLEIVTTPLSLLQPVLLTSMHGFSRVSLHKSYETYAPFG